MNTGVKTILVIDDEEAIREFARSILEKNGFQVYDALDGEAGIRILAANHVDLVITDLVMPGKEGIATIAVLRKEYPGTRIIAMSGAGNKDTYLELAQKIGADSLLCKPFGKREMIVSVEKALSAEPVGA
jgi:DNA-binding response OmpR family regulator